MSSSEDRVISSLIVCSQIHELIDNCYAISLKLSPETRSLIPMPALRLARSMLPNMYPKDLFIDEDGKEPEINVAGAVAFAKNNNISLQQLLFDNLLEKLDTDFSKAIEERDENYFLKNMETLLKGTLAESLTAPLIAIITHPELTKAHKEYIWDNLDSISDEVQEYKLRQKK